MTSTKFKWLSSALTLALLAPAGSVFGQQSDQQNREQRTRQSRQQEQQQQQNQQQQKDQQQPTREEQQQAREAEQDAQQAREAAGERARREGRERPTETETAREYAEQQTGGRQEQSEAMRHFLAGFYAGYSDGYMDGSDDLVMYIIELQQMRDQDFARRSGPLHPEHMRQRQMMRDRMRSQFAMGGPREQRLTGEVVDTKEVAFRNTDTKHLVVLLETEQGNRRIADLGPTHNFQDTQIEQGDQISVSGQIFTAGDRRILAARQIQVNDQTIQVEFRRPQRSGQAPDQQTGADRDQRERRTFRPQQENAEQQRDRATDPQQPRPERRRQQERPQQEQP